MSNKLMLDKAVRAMAEDHGGQQEEPKSFDIFYAHFDSRTPEQIDNEDDINERDLLRFVSDQWAYRDQIEALEEVGFFFERTENGIEVVSI